MSAEIYLEGGGDSKDGRSRCREGFRKLLETCDFTRRMPRLVACGGRNSAYDDFLQAHARARAAGTGYVGLLIDSEEPVANIDETWTHLRNRDHWETPTGAGKLSGSLHERPHVFRSARHARSGHHGAASSVFRKSARHPRNEAAAGTSACGPTKGSSDRRG